MPPGRPLRPSGRSTSAFVAAPKCISLRRLLPPAGFEFAVTVTCRRLVPLGLTLSPTAGRRTHDGGAGVAGAVAVAASVGLGVGVRMGVVVRVGVGVAGPSTTR